MDYRTSKTAREYLFRFKEYSRDELLDLRLKYKNREGLGVDIPDCFYEMEIKDIDEILNIKYVACSEELFYKEKLK